MTLSGHIVLPNRVASDRSVGQSYALDAPHCATIRLALTKEVLVRPAKDCVALLGGRACHARGLNVNAWKLCDVILLTIKLWTNSTEINREWTDYTCIDCGGYWCSYDLYGMSSLFRVLCVIEIIRNGLFEANKRNRLFCHDVFG